MDSVPIRVVIADDHQVLVDGLNNLIASAPDMVVVSTASNGNEALARLQEVEADVLLLDINMPDMDGIEVCQRALKLRPELGIISLTMHDSESFISRMIKAGAKGYLLKNTGQEELLKAIRIVSQGEQYFSQEVTQTLIGAISGRGATKKGLPKLSRREKEVLKYILEECTTQEIADKMYISVNTVESHRRNLLTKLGARNVAGLVRIAMENNLLDEA